MIDTKDIHGPVILVAGLGSTGRLSGIELRSLIKGLNDIATVVFAEDSSLDSFSDLDLVFELKRTSVVPELPKAFFFKEDNSSRNNSWKRARHEANRNAGLKFKGKK